MLLSLVSLFGCILLCCYSVPGSGATIEVYYVKPSKPASAECPKEDGHSLCHTLEYYASKRFNFTNNSELRFLEGEHDLNTSMTNISVSNFTVVGDGSLASISCFDTNLHFRYFTRVNISNLSARNCRVYADYGSEFHVKNVSFFDSGLIASNVEGSSSIVNSLFNNSNHFGMESGFHSLRCKESSDIMLDKNNFISAELTISLQQCTDVRIHITNSNFGNARIDSDFSDAYLQVYMDEISNNFILVRNVTFRARGSEIQLGSNCHCGNETLIQFSEITASNKFTALSANVIPQFYFDFSFSDCAVLIEKSTFSSDEHRYQTSQHELVLENLLLSANPRSISVLDFNRVKNATLDHCTFEHNAQSAIYATNSTLNFRGTNTFVNNSAEKGAAMQLILSYITLRSNSVTNFFSNHAGAVGGAIFIDMSGRSPDSYSLFFHVDYTSYSGSGDILDTIEVNFYNNTAGYAGSSIYGGAINQCDIFTSHMQCGESLFPDLFNISNTESDPSALTSDPYTVYFCRGNDRKPSDARPFPSVIHAFPGGEFTLHLAVVDSSYEGAVPGGIFAHLESEGAKFGPLQSTQLSTRPQCDNYTYSVFTAMDFASFSLAAKFDIPSKIETSFSPTVEVILEDCPFGFIFSPSREMCVCDPVLSENHVQCDINTQTILRPQHVWIGFLNGSSSNESGVIFHPDCPSGYCLPRDLNITSSSGDDQCEPHRTGVLCGKCAKGYSLTLGNQKCSKCSDAYLLLILLFALLGVLLVIVLFVLNLTVTQGTINGLIFYANVVAMSHTLLFSETSYHLYTFIAWLNLDFGIDACLYDGMDSYVKIWLQFIYPFYLWVIVLMIVWISKRFHWLDLGAEGREKAMNVLATLMLLSYTKLQQTVITIMSYAKLEYPDNEARYVWLYDANVEFFKGKHLFLGIAGIVVFIFLIIPYTVLVLLQQLLINYSDRSRLLWWIAPVFNSYAGPYRENYGFWTGILVVVRTIVILILFTVDQIDISLLAILIVSLVLLMTVTNGLLYRRRYLNILESFFYLQVGFFAAGIAYARNNSGSIAAVADISTGLVLIAFLIVIGWHIAKPISICIE